MRKSIRFDIITIFPHIFDSYIHESMIKRARAKKLVDIRVYNLRDFTKDKHHKIDDKPYGGGPGMVFKIEPLVKALSNLRLKRNTKIILFSPAGNQFRARIAREFAKKEKRIVMVAGRYEGIDERIKKIIKDLGFRLQEFSIGPYVLTGGELPALVMLDAVSRHIPGVLGKSDSLEEKRFGVGMPAYTRPETFMYKSKRYSVPKVLLSGDHKKIDEWRRKHAN